MRRPVYDRVVIRRAEGDFQSKGGIIIPDTAKENRRGEVIQTQSKKVKSSAEIGQVGTIAANSDATVGEMIASAMDNVVTLHGGKRWKAAIDYRGTKGVESVEHYFEEISGSAPDHRTWS